MKISRSFQATKQEPLYQKMLQQRSPKQVKSLQSNNLASTMDIGLKHDRPGCPKTTAGLHAKLSPKGFRSTEYTGMRPQSEKQPQSIFQTFLKQKQTKNRSTTNVNKHQPNNKEKYMNKIYELRKKVEELTLLNLRSKSKEQIEVKHKSKSKSKSHSRANKSPTPKPKPQTEHQAKNKSLSTSKAKSKSRPKSKSKPKSKSRSKEWQNQDYLLINNQILPVRNPEQIDQLISDDKNLYSTDYSKFKDRSRKAKLAVMSKFFFSFLQASAYQQFQADYDPFQPLLFMVNDLSHSEQACIYNELQRQDESKDGTSDEIDLKDMYRASVEIIESKHETAKGVIQAIGNTEKLHSLNEWRSSKFRQILVAKNFMAHNSRPVPKLEDLQEDEYLTKISSELRLQLQQMGQDKEPSSARSFHRQGPVDTIDLNNTLTNIDQDQIQLVRRARQIRDAVKLSIEFRNNCQLGRIIKDLEPDQICTSIDAVNEYLKRLCSFVLEHHSKQYLANIKKCYGLNVPNKLRNIRQGAYDLNDVDQQEVLSSSIFIDFEQQVVGVGFKEEQKQRKYYEHIHNKSMFDLLNHHLATFKPFYRNGQPLPWKYNSEFISSFLITEDNMKDVVENCIFSILNQAEHLCGTIINQQFLMDCAPKDMSSSEMALLNHVSSQTLEKMVADKTVKLIHEQIKSNAKDCCQQLIETGLLMDLSTKIETLLLQEFCLEIPL